MNTSVRHVAIIPDGNRTWAKEKGLSAMQGHLAGQKNSLDLMQWVFSHTSIDVFTIRGLSTENLHKRSKLELDYLADIYESALEDAATFMRAQKISLRWIGTPEGMTKKLIGVLENAVKSLTFDSNKTICLGINYGGHDEILRGIKKRQSKGANEKELTSQGFEKYLDLYGLPKVDLVVRTKSHLASRLSGYLLWRIGYAELYFSKILFPDFGVPQLQQALEWFEEVKEYRNFGK